MPAECLEIIPSWLVHWLVRTQASTNTSTSPLLSHLSAFNLQVNVLQSQQRTLGEEPIVMATIKIRSDGLSILLLYQDFTISLVLLQLIISRWYLGFCKHPWLKSDICQHCSGSWLLYTCCLLHVGSEIMLWIHLLADIKAGNVICFGECLHIAIAAQNCSLDIGSDHNKVGRGCVLLPNDACEMEKLSCLHYCFFCWFFMLEGRAYRKRLQS